MPDVKPRPRKRKRAPSRERPPPLAARVYGALAGGQFRSGEELAGELGVSRSAVWEAVRTLRALGTPLDAGRTRAYRLSHTGEPLDPRAIRRELAGEARDA